MPNMLFASNNISHWPNAVASSLANTFDPNRVPYAMKLTNYEVVNSPDFIPTTGDNTWVHFRYYCVSASQNFGRTDELVRATDVNGNLLFAITKADNDYRQRATLYLYDGVGGSLNTNTIVSWTDSKVNTVDVQYTVNGLGIECKVYVNSRLGATLTIGSNAGGYTAPSQISLGTGFTSALSSGMYISEVIVADGDTRNARLDLLRPTAAGTYTDWLGALTAIADDDPTSGMTTVDANKRHTVALSAYAGAANISNFVIVSQTTRGQNSPTKLKHSIRLSGVDYDTADIPVGFPLQYNLTDYKINPATSLPWEAADLSAIETGFVSVA